MPKAINMVGKVFNRLEVLEKAYISETGITYWNCKCSCGKIKPIQGGHLRSGHAKSCGCHNLELSSQRMKALAKEIVYQ